MCVWYVVWVVCECVCGMEGGEKYTQAVAVSLLTITVGGNTGNMEC